MLAFEWGTSRQLGLMPQMVAIGGIAADRLIVARAVFVEWSQGNTEYVRGFPTKQAADKWIAEESAAWLKTSQIE